MLRHDLIAAKPTEPSAIVRALARAIGDAVLESDFKIPFDDEGVQLLRSLVEDGLNLGPDPKTDTPQRRLVQALAQVYGDASIRHSVKDGLNLFLGMEAEQRGSCTWAFSSEG